MNSNLNFNNLYEKTTKTIEFTDNTNQVFLENYSAPTTVSPNIVPGDNKTINEVNNNPNEISFTDDSDTFNNKGNKLKSILGNKKFLTVMSILIFVAVSIVVIKAFYFGNKVDHYEEFFTEITNIEDNQAKVYQGKEFDNEILKKVAASELINCIKAPIDTGDLPESITNVINDINNYYHQSNNYFAFGYKDIFTGFTVTYNANQNIFTASAIKGPTDIYIYEMASQGKVNLDEELTYTGAYYNTGSGLLKNKPLNTRYTVRTLLEYSTVHSDNAAHNMLMDKYGRENMLAFWKNLGTTAVFTANSNWGGFNANDTIIYMEELYRFYASNKEYGEPLMQNFLNAYPSFIKGKNNYPVANKSGWSGTALHDIAIIFADNPYIVVGLSNMGTSNYTPYFNTVNDLAYKLHEEYWRYKINMCNDIKQY